MLLSQSLYFTSVFKLFIVYNIFAKIAVVYSMGLISFSMRARFFFAQGVLGVQLLVNFRNAFTLINAAVGGEVLEQN